MNHDQNIATAVATLAMDPAGVMKALKETIRARSEHDFAMAIDGLRKDLAAVTAERDLLLKAVADKSKRIRKKRAAK